LGFGGTSRWSRGGRLGFGGTSRVVFRWTFWALVARVDGRAVDVWALVARVEFGVDVPLGPVFLLHFHLLCPESVGPVPGISRIPGLKPHLWRAGIRWPEGHRFHRDRLRRFWCFGGEWALVARVDLCFGGRFGLWWHESIRGTVDVWAWAGRVEFGVDVPSGGPGFGGLKATASTGIAFGDFGVLVGSGLWTHE
jgi:hypothetical protein